MKICHQLLKLKCDLKCNFWRGLTYGHVVILYRRALRTLPFGPRLEYCLFAMMAGLKLMIVALILATNQIHAQIDSFCDDCSKSSQVPGSYEACMAWKLDCRGSGIPSSACLESTEILQAYNCLSPEDVATGKISNV